MWLPRAAPDAAIFYGTFLPLDPSTNCDPILHSASGVSSKAADQDFRVMPAQLRQWHILSLRALDARAHGKSYRIIAEALLGCSGSKKDWEVDPRKDRPRRLVAPGSDYRRLLHYPIKPDGH